MNTQDQVEESPSSAGHYWEIVVRRRWWLAISAIIVWACALALSLFLPAKYKSETVVLIEQEGVPAQYVTPNVGMDLPQRMQSLTEQIMSRSRLVQTMDEFHLYGQKGPGQVASDDAVDRMRKDITIELIKGDGQAELSAFKLTYSAPSPVLAQKVVGRLASGVINDNLHSEQQQSEDTTAFLESQLSQARDDLDRQEKALREFRSRYLGELPEQMSSNVQILAGLQSRLESATENLHRAEQQRLYPAPLTGQSPSSQPGVEIGNKVTSLDQQIERMKADLASLSGHYKPQHPDVVHLEDQIAKAEAMKRQLEGRGAPGNSPAVARGSQAISSPARSQSPVNAIDFEIANRKQEIKRLEAQIEHYQNRLNLTPVLAQQLADVTRNHEQSRAHYESLLAKKLQSEMATSLSRREQNGRFRTMDPPSLPLKPYWPDRLKFSLAGLFAGICLGLVGIVVVEVVEARVYGEDDLSGFAEVPVISTIPPLPTEAEQRRQVVRRRIEIAIASAVTALVPTITLLACFKS